MKLKLAVIALALVVGLNARAESNQSSQKSDSSSNSDSKIHLGVLGGLSLANTTVSTGSLSVSNNSARTGFGGGVFANYSINNWYSANEPQLPLHPTRRDELHWHFRASL